MAAESVHQLLGHQPTLSGAAASGYVKMTWKATSSSTAGQLDQSWVQPFGKQTTLYPAIPMTSLQRPAVCVSMLFAEHQ